MSTALQSPPQAPSTEFSYRQTLHDLSDTAGMARAMHEDGFALIPNVLSPEEVSDLREGIDRLKPFGFDSGPPKVSEHYKCVFNRDRLFLSYLDRPGIIDLAEATMGEECHVIGQTAWKSHPGHNGWHPHTDRVFVTMPEDMAMDPRFELPIYLCTAHFYLDDLTLDLAPTWVVPGSHRSGQQKAGTSWQGREMEPVLCKAGDVLFFRSEIWHTGSENTAQQERYLLQVHYSHRWIAQQFSPYMQFQFNPEILSVASQRQRRLLGEHRQGAYD